MFEPNNPADLAAAIVRTLATPEAELLARGSAARDRALSLFSPEKMLAGIENIIAETH